MSTQPTTVIKDILLQLAESKLTYALFAEKSDDPYTKSVLEKLSADRDHLIKALTHEEALEGKEMPVAATLGGVVNRVWLRIRDAVPGLSSADMLAECERAEILLRARYEEAIESEGTPAHVVRLLQQQRAFIDANIANIRGLRSIHA